MALSFTDVHRGRVEVGGTKEVIVDVTLDTDYPAGGWPIVPSTDLNLNGILVLKPQPIVGGYAFAFNHANSKLQAFYGDYDPAAAGPLIDCAVGENGLNALVVRCEIKGY